MATNAPQTILILAAGPIDQPRLSLDVEVREIQNGLRNSRASFQIRQQWATRPIDLRRALLDFRPEYVHFCGHGAGEAGIVLDGGLAEAEALADLFSLFADQIKCVVLNACYSIVQARAIARYIDFVVGMSTEIGDSAAIEFSTAFYDALGAGEPVPFAFNLGCNAIRMAGIPEYLTPQLLTRQDTLPLNHHRSRAIRLYDWDGAPAVSSLYGRDEIAETLRSWVVAEKCRVVLINGLSGVGKTDLATCLGRGGNRACDPISPLSRGIHQDFDRVVWRSLLNAPQPNELFDDLLGFFAVETGGRSLSTTEQIDLLLECLQKHHALVILDNIEAVLKAEDPTVNYQEGYEAYGRLFELAGKTSHQSCLLLTSREKPRPISELEGARKPVRSLHLKGIGPAEAQRLFSDVGNFFGTEENWRQVTDLYDGNPLALELAARHIEQVFGGDVGAFLEQGKTVFADLRGLLDWHLDRLTKEELQIVFWLAVERKPCDLSTLAGDVVSPNVKESVASIIQSLQRRVPLERTVSGEFGLQPVLIEHITTKLISLIIGAFAKLASLIEQFQPEDPPLQMAYRALEIFNSHLLVKSTVTEEVRLSQERIVLNPLANRLEVQHGKSLGQLLRRILKLWRMEHSREPGYLASNVLSLLDCLELDLGGFDFSELRVWEADLQSSRLQGSNFAFCDFRRTKFRQAFGAVFALQYTPDGSQIAVGDDNGEVRLFQVESGELSMRCIGHSDTVNSLAFSKDGSILATGSFDNSIRLWDPLAGRCTMALLGHESWIYSVALSSDGQILVSGSEDGTCRVWDLQTGRGTIICENKGGFFASVALSPNGRWLAAAGSDQLVYLFELPDLAKPAKLTGHHGRIRALAFSPNSELLASGAEDRNVIVWNAKSVQHHAMLQGHTAEITSLAFAPNGKYIASASQDQTVRLWSINERTPVREIRASEARVWCVAFHPESHQLATGCEDGTVRTWNTEGGDCLALWRGYSNKTWALAFLDAPNLLFAGNEDHCARIWNVRDGTQKCELRGHGSRIWSVASSPDGRWLATGSDDRTVRIWSGETGCCQFVLCGHTDWIRGVAFSGDSQFLASSAEDGRVLIWDADKGKCVLNIPTGINRVVCSVFWDCERCIAVAGSGGIIRLFSVVTGEVLATLEGHKGWINALTIVDDNLLVSCSDDCTTKVWDLRNNRLLSDFDCGSKVLCIASSHGCDTLITGSEDGLLRSWSLMSGRQLSEVRAAYGSLRAIAANSVGNLVASTGDDGAIRFWRIPDLSPAANPSPLRPPRPYEGMNIAQSTGLTESQREALLCLGAIDFPIAGSSNQQ